MGNLSKNISRHEVACKCGDCDCDTIDIETVNKIQECIEYFSKLYQVPIFIKVISGHRCSTHNKNVKGAKNSQHLQCRAIDFYLYYLQPKNLKIVPPRMVYTYLDDKYKNRFGIGKYDSFTHFDTRTGPGKRW